MYFKLKNLISLRFSVQSFFVIGCALLTPILLPKQVLAGLQIDIQSNLVLEPKALSYSNGSLYVDAFRQKLEVRIEPELLQEAIQIIERTNQRTFQVSIDETTVGSFKYIDPVLRDTQVSKLLLIADKSFANLVLGSLPLPRKDLDPFVQSLRLLENDPEYKLLPTKWLRPPESLPRIHLYFDPDLRMSGSIRLEFRPQILFRSADDYPVQVDKVTQSVGERPYLQLMKDIKKNPKSYRNTSSALDRAASITATLGFLASACKLPRSCSVLWKQAQSSDNHYEPVKKQPKYKPSSRGKYSEAVTRGKIA